MTRVRFYMQGGSKFETNLSDDIVNNLGKVISDTRQYGNLLRVSSDNSNDVWLNTDKIVIVEVMNGKAQGICS